MSRTSRARKIRAIFSQFSHQQVVQHLAQLDLDLRAEQEYVSELLSDTPVVLDQCSCGREYLVPQSHQGRKNTCPFCAGAQQMVHWFFEEYEDPANGVPHETAEGGYQYYAGGPYEADEELRDQYPYASDKMIEVATAQIERDGVEWVKVGEY